MLARIKISEEEFKRLQLLFDTEGIMYCSHVLHTEGFPTWVIFDHDMQGILMSTKEDGKLVCYLTEHGDSHLETLGEQFDSGGEKWQESTKNKISKST